MSSIGIIFCFLAWLFIPSIAFQSLKFSPLRQHRLNQPPTKVVDSSRNNRPSLLQKKVPRNNINMAESSDVTEPEKGLFRTVFHAVGATTSIVVAGTFFVALAYQRDALMVSFFVGSIVNAVSGKILKRILNQERPAELDANVQPGDKGMPSSHAMSLGFIGTFTALTLPWTQPFIVLYTLVSLAYRIDIKLHTWQQILVGVVVGSINGAVWRHLVDGSNPWNINLMEVARQTVLNDEGILPVAYLVVPAIVGFIVVGSVERRISGWVKKIKSE